MNIPSVWSWVVFGHRAGCPIAIMHVCMLYSNSPANMGTFFSADFHHFALFLHPKYSEKPNLLVPLGILSNQPKASFSFSPITN
jgi:hypothetical protein